MNFCPGCGSANLDTDAACRVCGRALHEEATAKPVAAAPPVGSVRSQANGGVAPGGPAGWPTRSGAPDAQDGAIAAQGPRRPDTGTATPSGFESPAPAAQTRSDGALPSFMRPAAKSTAPRPAVETTSLISENDLPDWIKQIAADDARKAAAALATDDGPGGIAGSSLPHHLGRRSLPGETITGGPASSSWLNRRDAVAGAASSAWDATLPSPVRPIESVAPALAAVADAGVAETADGLPIVSEASAADALPVAVEKPGKRRRRGAEQRVPPEATLIDASSPEASPKPTRGLPGGSVGGDRKRLLLMVAASVAIVLLLASMLL